MKSIREWISIKVVKSPRLIILLCVLIANVAFICVSALVISLLTEPSLENGGYWNSLLNTVIMYLDIGGIETVIEDISQANALLVLSCVVIIFIGLVFFTFALIGYMSDFISNFIENADSSAKRLRISNHTVILNWNSRAVEIINDLLYKNTKERIVVLAGNDKDDVLRDIEERLAATIETENAAVQEAAASLGFLERRRYIRGKKIKKKLTIIAREGDTCSTKQLGDISIKHAKSVIILSNSSDEALTDTHTIKTLIQVAQMTAAEDSADDQQIVVEVEDDQTLALVDKIIRHKMRRGKCNIVPVPVNRILGYIFSQFSIMPELNMVYSALFSFKGADLYAWPAEESVPSDTEFVSGFLDKHLKAIPLTAISGDDGNQNCYFFADCEQDIRSTEPVSRNDDYSVSLNPGFEIDERHVIILGHSSKNQAMMEGFAAFNWEWKKKDGSEVLDVTIIDDESSLLKQDYYNQYPWVKKIISAEICEQHLICDAISEFIDVHSSGGCILILSDDTASGDNVDESALTYLVLVQDIISSRLENDPGFDLNGIDMIVEIVDPKNHDVVNHYNMKNVVISNRYVSKMIMQVGENKALFDFYMDFLTYDEPDSAGAGSKELYIKRADMFFSEIPQPCTAADLIRAVYHSSPDDNKSILLGYFRSDGEMILFSGDQNIIHVALSGQEKLILFSDH